MIRHYKVGDRVEMKSNLGRELLKMKQPRLGFITHIDGAYILVRPRWKKWVQEFYPNELNEWKKK